MFIFSRNHSREGEGNCGALPIALDLEWRTSDLPKTEFLFFLRRRGMEKNKKARPKKSILGEFVGLEEIVNFGLTN